MHIKSGLKWKKGLTVVSVLSNLCIKPTLKLTINKQLKLTEKENEFTLWYFTCVTPRTSIHAHDRKEYTILGKESVKYALNLNNPKSKIQYGPE